MDSPNGDSKADAQIGGIEQPITQSEMQALLAPLHICFERMEYILLELSSATPAPREAVARGCSQRSLDYDDGCNTQRKPLKFGIDMNPFSRMEPNLKKDLHASWEEKETIVERHERELSKETGQNDKAPQNSAPGGSLSPSNDSPDDDSEDEESSPTPCPSDQGGQRGCQDASPQTRKSGAAIDAVELMRINVALQDLGATPFNKAMAWAERIAEKWNSLNEPDRTNALFRLTTSRSFETVVMIAITFNSALIALVADWQIQNIGSTEPPVLAGLESSMFIFFFTELLMRLGAHRCYFFFNKDMHWNIFDCILVSISLVDFIFELFVDEKARKNVGFMRLLRLFKLARIFRSLRSFRFLKSLSVLLESFQKSFLSLFWGMIMLAFVLYLFSLIFIQALVEFLTYNDELEPAVKDNIETKFGSLGSTILSLYMSVTGGDDWSNFYKILDHAGALYGLVFVFFTFFFLFALFNILTGSLVEKAMSSSKPDRYELILAERKKLSEEKQQFMDICKAMDKDRNGKISWDEVQQWMSNPVMRAYMASVGIQMDDAEIFFATVGARSDRGGRSVQPGEITIEHFVEGCMHMKGTATAIDMQRQLFEMHVLHQDMKGFEAACSSQLRDLEQAVSQISICKDEPKLPSEGSHGMRVLLSKGSQTDSLVAAL